MQGRRFWRQGAMVALALDFPLLYWAATSGGGLLFLGLSLGLLVGACLVVLLVY